MNYQESDLRLYKEKQVRKRMLSRLLVWGIVVFLIFFLIFLLFKYYFVVRDISVEGSARYTNEELLQAANISIKDGMFSLSEKEIETRLKKAFPYVKSVALEKDYPDSVKLVIKEEYTTFYFELMGEYFLFNHELRLMEKFDSYEEMTEVREPIFVQTPFPESCIVPQYIHFFNDSEYIETMIDTVSRSQLLHEVKELDLRDKFVIRLVLENDITVDFGDYMQAEEKFLALYRLLDSYSQKMTGTVDFTDYPNCFYALEPIEQP